jgi:hypothetical protein
MDSNTVGVEDFLSGNAVATDEKPVISADEFLNGTEPEPSVSIPSIDDEHHGRFLQDFGGAIYNEMLNSAIRLGGSTTGAVAGINNVIGSITGLNAFKKYRETFVEPGQQGAEAAREVAPGSNLFERQYFGLIDAVGSLAPTIPFDVMTGGATKIALAGRILPRMEAMLARIPNFALGSGWKGMVEGVQRSGSVPEAVVGGVVGIGENVAWNSLFAASGVGLKGIGKMAAMGMAQAFYSAAKEGRTPTSQEITDSTTQAAMLGVVFTALPHLAEGSQIEAEKRALKRYEKKVENLGKDIGGESLPNVESTWSLDRNPDEPFKGDFKEGVRYKDSIGDNPYIYESRYVDPKQIIQNVNLEGKTLQQVIDMPSTQKYIQWYKEGKLPPPIDVVITDSGDMRSVNRRRVVAAVEAGVTKIPANVEIGRMKELYTTQSSDPTVIQKIMVELFTDDRIRPEIRESLAQPFLDMLDERGSLAPMDFKYGMWKDRSKLRMYRETMERNIENVAGPDAKSVRAETTERVKENETARARWQSGIMRAVRGKEVVGKGIRPNTKEAELMMRYGEGRMTEKKLQAASPDKWGEIEQAAAYSRRVYDESLDAHNAVRAKYGYDPINKIPEYFRHFQELSLANEMFGILLGGKKPPTEIAGVLDRAKYGKPFSSVEYERKGGPFKEDGVLALQNYIKAAGQQIFHLDSVQRVRALENAIRQQALVNEVMLKNNIPVAKLDLSNFVENLTHYADILAGQPSKLTQAIKGSVDRPLIAGIRALQRNVVANMIGDNISATFMNLLPVTQGVATTNPKDLVRGLVTSGLHLRHEVPFEFDGVRSEFYDRRYPVDFLPGNWVENLVEHSFVLPKVIDRFMVQTLIAGKYYEGRGQGLNPKDAMKAADNYTVRVVSDRTKGQLPNIMSEPDLKMFSAFQTEINNLWSWMAHDVAGNDKTLLRTKIGQMAVFAIASNVINGLYEKMMGRRPQLDFLYILGTLAGVTKSGQNRAFLDRVAPAGKDFLGNVPFGNLFIDGGRFPLPSTLPDMNVVLQDPEHRALSEFLKPLLYWHPFGGGGQARKTWEGVAAWNQGYVATPSGNIRYEVAKDFSNFVRGFLFGKNAFPEAVRYWATPPEER